MNNLDNAVIKNKIITLCSLKDVPSVFMVSKLFNRLVEESKDALPLFKTIQPVILLMSKCDFFNREIAENKILIEALAFKDNCIKICLPNSLAHHKDTIRIFDGFHYSYNARPEIETLLTNNKFQYNEDLLYKLSEYARASAGDTTKWIDQSLIAIKVSKPVKQALLILKDNPHLLTKEKRAELESFLQIKDTELNQSVRRNNNYLLPEDKGPFQEKLDQIIKSGPILNQPLQNNSNLITNEKPVDTKPYINKKENVNNNINNITNETINNSNIVNKNVVIRTTNAESSDLSKSQLNNNPKKVELATTTLVQPKYLFLFLAFIIMALMRLTF